MSSLDKNKKSGSSKKRVSTKKEIDKSLLLNSPQLSTTQTKKENLNIVEQLNLNNVFTQALERHKKDILEDKKNKLKEINHLSAMAEEYLSTFVLIGYSLQNEKVVIFNATNSKDEAALVDLLRATFIEIVNNRP